MAPAHKACAARTSSSVIAYSGATAIRDRRMVSFKTRILPSSFIL